MMKRHCLATVLAMSAAGCVTDNPATPADPTQPVKIICLPMVTYSAGDQADFAREVGSLDLTTYRQVIRFLGDYRAMRAANRACSK